MINELVVATHNQGKVEEFKSLMKDLPIEIKYLADFDAVEAPAETGRTFAANARQKATYYAKKLGKPCIADDSGLEVQALDGAPGVRSARYAGEKASDEDNNNLLLQLISDILDLAKLEAGTLEFKMKDTEATSVCKSVASSVEMRVKPGVKLWVACPETQFHFTTDPNRLRQVLINFATNAAKFTDSGYIRLGYLLTTTRRI